MKPRLLDLFCGAGGAAVGYARAGFEVVGVDNRPQPRYPFEFVQADALEYLRDDFGHKWIIGDFDAIHASPLWWRFTRQAEQAGTAADHPDDIAPTLALLQETGLPFVLEIGTTSPQEAVTICGVSCGLSVVRHMRFTTNWPLMVPPCSHKHGGAADGLYVPYRGSYHKEQPTWRTVPHSRKRWREAAGVPWMTGAEGELAVPPTFTELIGAQLLDHLRVKAPA